MGLFEQFPYTNFHGLNLDWLLKKMEELAKEMGDLSTYVRSFIDTQIEPLIEAKLDEMVADGELDEILARMEVIDYVTPEMFGAKGDGLTDDTIAFQRAVDSGRAVCLKLGSIYLLTETIRLRSMHLDTGTRERVSRMIFAKAEGDYNSPNSQIRVDFADETTPIFSIEASNWRMVNVMIQCSNHSIDNANETLTCFRTNTSSADVDFQLLNCQILRARVLMDLTGRGFTVNGCQFTRIHQLVNIKWSGDTGGSYHNNVTGQRALNIINNRFHSVRAYPSTPFIQLANGANAFGFRFCNNLIDRGTGFFMECLGTPSHWLIDGNTIVGMAGGGGSGKNGLVELNSGVDGFTISNNMIVQVPGANEGVFTNLVYAPEKADTTLNGLVIANNTINTVTNGGLLYASYDAVGGISSQRLVGCAITGNVIQESVVTDDVIRGAVRCGSMHAYNSIVSNNVIGAISGSTAYYAVCAVGLMVLEYSKIIGNVIAGSAQTFYWSGTGSQTITGCLIDDDLMTSSNDSDERI